MTTTIIITGITCLALILAILFFPKIKIFKFTFSTYILIALLGALLLLLLGLAPIKEVSEKIIKTDTINPLKILILFFSMTIISIYLDEVGFFKYLAYKSVRLAKKNQISLFLLIYLLASILTIFTSNDIVILTFIPFICYFCKNANINPLPYLVGCFVGANTWSMMLIIGNPTNIYLATSFGITFLDYLKIMVLPTLAAGILEIIIILLIFKKKLKQAINFEVVEIKINSKFDLICGLMHLIICLIFLIISSYLNISMYLIALISATSLIIINLIKALIKKEKPIVLFNALKRLPYGLIFFVISMFIIVEALNYNGVTFKIYQLLGENNTILSYGYSSFIVCNLINNIPMSVLYATIPNLSLGKVYASIIGSNIGAFLTPIGALAGIMFTNLVNKYDIKYRFIDFIKYGVIIAIPTITVAILMLLIVI